MKEDLGVPRELDGRAFYHRCTGRRHVSHRHVELEVNLALTGTATYVVDNKRFDLQPGTLLWLFPRQDHFLDPIGAYDLYAPLNIPSSCRSAVRVYSDPV